ncbi:uncharacterized protein METZ01_LOCUS440675 [marine metagenome]|uniref:Uncharacterized protein n=1 Tax=marine metagenome TaxID=408172 RepID=A0A382YXF9_9ZZZZ
MVEDEGAYHLTNSKTLTRLEKIGLAYNSLGKPGNEAYQRFRMMRRIIDLHRDNRLSEIGKYMVGDLGVSVLMNSPYVSELAELDLQGNGLTDAAVVSLSNSEKLGRLESLNLSSNHITDVGAIAIAESKTLTNLKQLDLNFNQVGNEGAKAISSSLLLANLESLKLGQNRIGTVGAKALNESKTLTNLIHPIFGFY